jgi:hypothetical protein
MPSGFLPEGVAPIKYVVTLTAEECHHLEQLLAKGKAAARTLSRVLQV